MNIKTLTVDEYYNFIDWFFSEENKSNNVVKLVCHSMGYNFTYLVKAGVKSNKDFTRDWYKNEPILQRHFSSLEEVFAAENETLIQSSAGRMVRCLFSKSDMCYQPAYYIPKDPAERKAKIDEMKEMMYRDCFMGFFRDPFTFVAEYKTKEDGKYIDDGRNNPEVSKYNKDKNNYRVFYIEMTPEEFLDEDERYLNHIETGEFNDGFIESHGSSYEYTEEWINFLNNNKI